MTIVNGDGYVSFVDHAFTGTLAAVIADAGSTKYTHVTGGTVRVTGAAALFTPRIVKAAASADTVADQDAFTLDLDDGELQTVAPFRILAAEDTPNSMADPLAGGSLSIAGGAASCVLNGTIYFQTYPLAVA